MIIISTNENIKDEQELKDKVITLSFQYPDQWILADLMIEDCNYGIVYIPHSSIYESYYYNDYDDYEDEIEVGSKLWFKTILKEDYTESIYLNYLKEKELI